MRTRFSEGRRTGGVNSAVFRGFTAHGTDIKRKKNRKGRYFVITWDENYDGIGPITEVSLKELRGLIRNHNINGAQWLKQVGKKEG